MRRKRKATKAPASGSSLVTSVDEIYFAARMLSWSGEFCANFEELELASVLTAWIEDPLALKEGEKLSAIQLKLTGIESVPDFDLDGCPGEGSIFFEADVLRRVPQIESGTEDQDARVCGMLFPSGFITVVDTSPGSEHMRRLAMAGLAYLGLID